MGHDVFIRWWGFWILWGIFTFIRRWNIASCVLWTRSVSFWSTIKLTCVMVTVIFNNRWRRGRWWRGGIFTWRLAYNNSSIVWAESSSDLSGVLLSARQLVCNFFTFPTPFPEPLSRFQLNLAQNILMSKQQQGAHFWMSYFVFGFLVSLNMLCNMTRKRISQGR